MEIPGAVADEQPRSFCDPCSAAASDGTGELQEAIHGRAKTQLEQADDRS